ncbi:hypothetical protein VTL71DRAFT_4816 [Oculimacula yallundae]|uniref:Uncharacterized protein n=1 Tax=Oculimacula yallundae TaxID=86028 RepID=A0ABR4C479_9HELO
MRFELGLLFSILGSVVWAAPGLEGTVFERGTSGCNTSSCLRAVQARTRDPSPSSATADCKSFLRKTVIPCASTTYKTITVTNTAPASSVTVATVFNTLMPTRSTTTIQPLTFTSIFTTTSTQFTTVTATETSGTTLVQVSDTTTFATATTTITGGGGLKARAFSCFPLTYYPSIVPTYASACSGTVGYSSACSCAVGSQTAFTLPRNTITCTVKSTRTITPTSLITARSTIVSTVTQLFTSTIFTTVSTTSTSSTTAIIDETTTLSLTDTSTTLNIVTATTTTSTTVAPQATACRLQVVQGGGGLQNGLFITLGSDGSYNFQSTSTTKFNLRSDGSLFSEGSSSSAYAKPSSESSVTAITSDEVGDSGRQSLNCVFEGDFLACTLAGNTVVFTTATSGLSLTTGGNVYRTIRLKRFCTEPEAPQGPMSCELQVNQPGGVRNGQFIKISSPTYASLIFSATDPSRFIIYNGQWKDDGSILRLPYGVPSTTYTSNLGFLSFEESLNTYRADSIREVKCYYPPLTDDLKCSFGSYSPGNQAVGTFSSNGDFLAMGPTTSNVLTLKKTNCRAI